jgi:glutathione-independent formaldehyde dehydrogenase
MATANRVIAFMGPRKVEVKSIGYPKLQNPKGKKIEHGVILKIVSTNICGSDQHIYHGRFAAPEGMISKEEEQAASDRDFKRELTGVR